MQRILATILMFSLLENLVCSDGQGSVDYEDQSTWSGDCQQGTSQSPININTKKLKLSRKIKSKIKFLNVQSALVPEDDSFGVTSQDSGYVFLNDKRQVEPQLRLYKSKQFHFHAPSEHTVNGNYFPLQMHNFFVPLTNEEGNDINLTSHLVDYDTQSYNNQSLYAAVVSYLFYISDDQDAIDFQLTDDLDGQALLNRMEVFGKTTDKAWYHYRGSTTVPPCTQEVDWFIYRRPLAIKESCYEIIKANMNNGKPNAREIQQLNDRDVYIVAQKYLHR